MIFVSLDICGREVSQVNSNLLLFCGRAPEVTNVGGLVLLHVIHGVIDCFFLGHKPLVNLEKAWRDIIFIVDHAFSKDAAAWDLIDRNQVVP